MNLTDFGMDNRQLAFLIWLIILFVWMISKKDIRQKILNIVKILINPKVFFIFLFSVVYFLLFIVFLIKIDYWHNLMLMDSIFWFFGAAVVLIVNYKEIENSEKFNKRLSEYFSFAVILEFFINAYVFSLPTELIMLPVITLVSLFLFFTERDKKYKFLARTTGIVLMCVLFIYFGRSIIGFYNNFSTLKFIETIEKLLLVPILTILYIPFIYFIAIFSAYDSLFSRINLFYKTDRINIKKIKIEALKECGINLKKINIFSNMFYKKVNLNQF